MSVIGRIYDRTLTLKQKQQVLEKYDHVCVYCFEEATTIDHILPWSYRRLNDDKNLVACCFLCNILAHNLVFKTFDEKYRHLKKKRDSRQRKTPIALWTEEEINELEGALKKYIEKEVIVLESEEERSKIRERLEGIGFTITTGSKGD